jgi:hypothetical protein
MGFEGILDSPSLFQNPETPGISYFDRQVASKATDNEK